MSSIRITIGVLSLKGFDRADGRLVVDTLQNELRRVLAASSGTAEWTALRSTPILRLGPMPIDGGSAGSRRFGRSAANAISKRLKR